MSSDNDSNIQSKVGIKCPLEFFMKQPKYNVYMHTLHYFRNLTALRAVSKLWLIETTYYF